MSRWSIQRIKAMLLSIEYGILFVDTVDTKIKACKALNAIYVDTVDTKHIHTFLLITFLIFNGFSIRKKFWKAETQGFSTISSILYMSTLSIQDKDLLCIQCYLCWHCRYKTHPHIPAHNFLNIQWIFNPQKVLESWDSGLFNHTIYTIYVDTVDKRQGSLMHSMLSLSTLSIQRSKQYYILCIE